MVKELILAGKFKELYQSLFDQKLDPTSKGSFTAVLSEDEEVFAVEQMVQGNAKVLGFLLKYQKHYALSNKAVDLLIKNIADSNVQKLLSLNFKQYGYNLEQGFAICKAAESLDAEFLYNFCTTSKVFYKELYARLSLICPDKFKEICEKRKITAESWGELYKATSQYYFGKK
jgi:hypothetical protein